MVRTRVKPKEILMKLRQVEALQGHGAGLADTVRQIGVTQQAYYCWRRKFGWMN